MLIEVLGESQPFSFPHFLTSQPPRTTQSTVFQGIGGQFLQKSEVTLSAAHGHKYFIEIIAEALGTP